ncbi:uncharacterized protein G2W53_003960 [Senna tora]|uniref:DUF4283 domain-containing protein n=1 Tax=Senna tora TaxID=362788 RepID=A0A834XBI1_9FABA|nr:uncharacterized protein G2W53_003960 [Senna tora]
MKAWNLIAEPFLLSIGSGFFVVRFQLIEDKWKVLLKGTTFIDGFFLSICPRIQRFNPSAKSKEAMSPIWLRLENLPVESTHISEYCSHSTQSAGVTGEE